MGAGAAGVPGAGIPGITGAGVPGSPGSPSAGAFGNAPGGAVEGAPVGAAGAGAAGGAALGVTTLEDFVLFATYVSMREVSMNVTAAIAVAFCRNVAAPRVPNIVWLEPAPNAAPMSAPLPA